MALDLGFLDEVSIFLETQDGELGSLIVDDEPLPVLSPVDESSDSSSFGKKNNKRRCELSSLRRQKYRQRLRDERDELSQQAAELSKQIQEFAAERQGVHTTARIDLVVPKSFWKRVAEQQRGRRRRAEMEKARLSAIVNAQAAYLDSLGMSLRECPNMPSSVVRAATHAEGYDTLSDRRWLRLKSSDAALYEAFVLDSHSSKARIRQVFEECGMDSLPIGTVSAHRLHQPNGEALFTQLVNKVVFPFTFEDTCTCLWNVADIPHRRLDRQVFENVADRDNTRAVKFRLTKTLSCGSTVSILKRVVSRRFTGDGCVVMVWKAFWEGEGVFSGMDVDETSWAQLRPHSDGSRTGTILRGCTRLVSNDCAAANAEDADVKAFLSMIQEMLKENEREITKSFGPGTAPRE